LRRGWFRHCTKIPEGSEFDYRCCYWKLYSTYFFWLHTVPGFDSVFHKNEHEIYFARVKEAGLKGRYTLHLYVPTVEKSSFLKLLEQSGVVIGLYTVVLV
jgi:hypothetical protein